MSDNPELSLPAKAPSMARYHNEPMTLHPAALYTLVDLDNAELEYLERECESGCVATGSEPGTSVRLAPRSRFVGQSLRAVFDYHLELGPQNTFEPRYFIVTSEKDWQTKGVILVTLDDDELDCNVDSFRIKAADAGLSVVNLQIGNTSWGEEKDGYELHLSNADGDKDDDNDNDNEDEGDDDDDGPPRPRKNVPLGYYVPIYIHSSLSEDKVIADLEPAFKYKSPEEYACRIQAKLTPAPSTSNTVSTQDLIQQAVSLHPLRCAKNRYLQKEYIIVIDTEDPNENGMLMIKLPPWDANRSGTTEKADLRRIGEELALATTQHIRIPYSCYEGLQTRLLILANGDADWPSEDVRVQPVFVVFQYNTHHKELGFGASLIDTGAAKRKSGEDRLVYAPEAVKRVGEGLDLITWNYDEAVRRFPWFCREKRFVEGLDTTYFICVDGDDVAKTGVLLVLRKWDGSLWGRTRDELLGLPVDGVKDERVPIKEALALLEKGRKGEINGMSESLRDFFS
ncbi:hypothetical protein F5Y00DRAFT_235621 [Daldinia vernicosa]|uniref:uncharacterized protein n=1 Tax=Daldinia vernicosa TaxID=114800 RepID=UPI00200746F3|nr:uncharacterized protein F5Y00DRAFT_235621 [Daldinia vernicosa]KAI0849404.1 hypothetical protein F5Y00DRAFT_235621 [Daldinia vernicosa]